MIKKTLPQDNHIFCLKEEIMKKKLSNKQGGKKSTHSSSHLGFSLENIINSLPGCVYWKNKDGVYMGYNNCMLKIANVDGLKGKTDFDLPWKQEALAIQQNDQEVMFSKKPLEVNETITLASGQSVVMSTYKTPLQDENGNVIGILGISFDISEKVREENPEQLALNNIIANMPGHVYWKDKNGVYLGCNNRQAKSLGFQFGSEVIGKTDFELPWKKDMANLFRQNDIRIMQTGEVEVVEEKAQVDGKETTVLSQKTPLKNNEGDAVGILGISIDISDRKKMETELREAMIAAQAASRAKSEFIANISHDLRTPLTGVVTMSDDLTDRLKGLEGEQEAKWLYQSGQQLLDFCNNILDSVSADNYTEQDLKEECFDLRELIQAVGNIEMPMIKSKGLNFIVKIDNHVPSYLIKDEAKLYRILLNLIGNAIKFTKKGYVSIDVNLIEKNNDNVTLKFCIIDTGIGIKPELQAQIFDRFFRADPSYKGIYKGNGLGLYIAQKYVQLLGSDRIYIESEEGKGCRFFFTLSFKLGSKKDAIQIGLEKEQKSQQINQVVSDITSKTSECFDDLLPDNAPLLLLIEDNKPALLGLESMIKRAGCRFKSVEDGEKAVELAKIHSFDLIISDIGLPGISGIEATKAIRAWEKENHKKKIPIVALTGHAAQMIEPEYLQVGIDKVLTKPATFNQIKNLLQEFISNNEKVGSKNTQQELSLPPQTGLGRDLPDTEEKLFMLDQYPYFSMEVVTNIYGENCHKLVAESLKSMSDLIPKDKEEIKEAFLARNWDRVEELAHRMKGGATYTGTVRLKYACQYLERYRKVGHSKSLEKLYYQLIQVVDETKNYIDKWLNMNTA